MVKYVHYMLIIHRLPVFKENIVCYFLHNKFLSANCMHTALLSVKSDNIPVLLEISQPSQKLD